MDSNSQSDLNIKGFGVINRLTLVVLMIVPLETNLNHTLPMQYFLGTSRKAETVSIRDSYRKASMCKTKSVKDVSGGFRDNWGLQDMRQTVSYRLSQGLHTESVAFYTLCIVWF